MWFRERKHKGFWARRGITSWEGQGIDRHLLIIGRRSGKKRAAMEWVEKLRAEGYEVVVWDPKGDNEQDQSVQRVWPRGEEAPPGATPWSTLHDALPAEEEGRQ